MHCRNCHRFIGEQKGIRLRLRINLIHLLRVILATTIGVGALMAADDQYPITVASTKSEQREVTSWEEPALFPSDLEDSSASVTSIAGVRKAKKASEADASSAGPFDSGQVENTDTSSESDLQANNRIRGIESNGLGLAASRERDRILARIQSDPISQPYNIKIGRIPFRLASSLDFDFTDNSDRASQNKESELIILPRLDVSSSIKITSRISLNLALGVGYIKYLNKNENDRVLTIASLSPNADTGISLDMKIGKFLVSVYDRPVVPQFQADAATQRNQTQYSQFSNTAGLSVLWNINSQTEFSFRYNHNNLFSLSSEKNTTDGATDSFLASLSKKLGESLGVGIQGGGDVTTYENELLNNGISYHVGLFANYRLSSYLQVEGGFGFQGGNYDSGGSNEDASSLGTYYANLSISNNLNTRLSHSISLGREAQRGAFSNFTVNNYIRYQAVWDVLHDVSLNTWASFEDIDESGGIFAQHFRYFTLGASCSLRVTSRISLSLTYAFTKRIASNDPEVQGSFLDFSENRVSLRLSYAF